MSFVFDVAHKLVAEVGLSNLNLFAKLVMGDEHDASSVPDEPEVDFLGQFSDLLEYNGSNYEEQEVTLTVTTDKPNDRANVTLTAPVVFGASDGLGPGAMPAIGMLVYHKVTNNNDSVPLWFYDGGGFPVTGRDEPVTVNFPTFFLRLKASGS